MEMNEMQIHKTDIHKQRQCLKPTKRYEICQVYTLLANDLKVYKAKL